MDVVKREPDLESVQSDFIPSKSTSKVIKKFMTCICELIQHVENVLSNSDGLFNSTDGQDTKLSIKEFDDAVRYLQSIRKCCLQLSLLCVDQNIYVNCVLDFRKIEFYSLLDDSTRSLVINFLTENIVYLIEHIGYLISMFKEEKNVEEAKNITKSLRKIYNQILYIPLNPNLDEIPDAFQNLNISRWQNESVQNLTEKLSLLRTALIKFKKIFKKRIFQPDLLSAEDNNSTFFENIDITLSNLKRKNISDESSPKKLKRGNSLASLDQVFLVPETPSDAEKHKKKKQKTHETESDSVIIESDTEKKKRNKLQNGETRSINSVSDTESIKSKKKSKIKLENVETESVHTVSDAESVSSKIKYIKIETGRMKHKIKLEQNENKTKKDNNTVEENESITSLKTPEKKNKSLNDSHIFKTPEKKDKSLNTSHKSSEKKDKTLNASQNSSNSSNKKKRSRIVSQSSVTSISQLYTSQSDIEDADLTINSPVKKHKSNNKENIAQKKLDNYIDKYQSKKAKKKKQADEESLGDEVIGALTRGELEVDYEEDPETVFNEMCRENHLNENERLLYIQDLLLEAKEKLELSDDKKEKLKNLHVLIDFEVPESHKIEKRISAGPLPDEIPKLAALGVTDRLWDQDDDKTLRENWKEFCKKHDLDEDPTPFFKMRHGRNTFCYTERIKFVQYLGKNLPHRPLHSILRRFKVLFREKPKLGRFTPEEDQIILSYCNRFTHDRCYADLANVLNRSRVALERRYRNLKREYNKRIKWTPDMDSDIIKGLLKAIGSKDVQDLRHAKLKIEYFKKIANEFKVPFEKVKIQWLKNIYTKLFASEILHSGRIRVKIIKLLTALNITDWKKVNWDDLLSHFDGFTKEFIWNQLILIHQQVVPKHLQKDMRRMLEKCNNYIDQMTKNGMEPFTKKVYRRYKFENGELETYIK